ncbi:hypothetical protein LKO27_03765 [Tessaracoccus sp. OS52]|uniref:hypothetical protein n=1 Tax=Tessaracoccus sp. OS52 TaxID=2886691 RepID=UPI001D118204|nr:hypothetical protein [Tessaracoccus sp. OS52]MCC2592536.1 hypothetical protein [Tessaracoccus sp. OS52]
MGATDVAALMAEARRDAEAARQITRWAETLRAAHEARTMLAQLPPADLREALRASR